jgi:hypothetical protein
VALPNLRPDGCLNSHSHAARWLLYRGKPAKAERALVRIHKGSDDHETLVQEQLAILNKSREEEAESSSAQSRWSDLWRESTGSPLHDRR